MVHHQHLNGNEQLKKRLRVLLLSLHEEAWEIGRSQVWRVSGVSLEQHGQAWSRDNGFMSEMLT